jgi:competence protein ComFB
MEDIVRHGVDELIPERRDVCSCDECKLDIMALVLNKMPAKYVVTKKGRMYAKLAELELQSKMDIIKEITKAINIVMAKPQH